MTHLDQAIRDAVEGGYVPKYVTDDFFFTFGKDGSIGQNRRELSGIFLDPAFWQALGKARGWGFDDAFHDQGMLEQQYGTEWKYRWHRFIDHLSQGKDIESFFASISTNN